MTVQHKIFQVVLGAVSALLVVALAGWGWLHLQREPSEVSSTQAPRPVLTTAPDPLPQASALTAAVSGTITSSSTTSTSTTTSTTTTTTTTTSATPGSAVNLLDIVVYRAQQTPQWEDLKRGGEDGITSKKRKVKIVTCRGEAIQTIPFRHYCGVEWERFESLYFQIRGFVRNGKEYIQVKAEDGNVVGLPGCGMRRLNNPNEALCTEQEWLQGAAPADKPRRYP